jgi:hypothetical protein
MNYQGVERLLSFYPVKQKFEQQVGISVHTKNLVQWLASMDAKEANSK